MNKNSEVLLELSKKQLAVFSKQVTTDKIVTNQLVGENKIIPEKKLKKRSNYQVLTQLLCAQSFILALIGEAIIRTGNVSIFLIIFTF